MQLSTRIVWCIAASHLYLACLWASTAAAAERPNIVFILADDLGYGDVQCFNDEAKIPTPHVDRLADEGMRFTDAHSASAVCSPTRYGILTGRYAWRTRLQRHVLGPYDPPLISAERLTVPGLLASHGYRTACVGKWHLGWNWPGEIDGQRDFTQAIADGPTTRGFHHYFGTDVPNYPPYCFIDDDRTVGIPTAWRSESNRDGRPGAMLPDWDQHEILPALARQSRAWIAEQAASAEPFFLYLPLTSPHTPITPSPAFQGKSGICPIADLIMETDWVVGEVLAELDQQRVADNTLVIFTSDNGHASYVDLKTLQAAGHEPSGPLRGYKTHIYEGGHRVAYVARWPGVVAAGTTCEEPICHNSLLASAAELLGEPLPDSAALDSFSILPLLRGESLNRPTHPAIVNHSVTGQFAIRRGDWKLILGEADDGTQDQLYNLADDLAETTNVIGSHADLTAELLAQLNEIVARGRSTPGPTAENDVPVDVRGFGPPAASARRPAPQPQP